MAEGTKDTARGKVIVPFSSSLKPMPGHTPHELGYHMPAEWAPHAATWIAWPHNPKTWPKKFGPVPAVFAQFVRAVAPHEPVHILAGGLEVMSQARDMVGDIANVTLHDIPTNDAWVRDYGPIFLIPRDPKNPNRLPPAIVDWRYNAWGGKYPPYDRDDAAAARINASLAYRQFNPGIILEGGSIDVNGAGTVLTTEACLLNPNRNPQLSRSQIEKYLRDYLGASHVIWLHGELAGDDTDGHIDQLARFVSPTKVVAARQDDPSDENFAPLADNWRRLERATDQDGNPLEILPLPMPLAKYHDGQRLPASYANFYIANGLVVASSFDDPADDRAADTLARCFPDRKIVQIPSLDLIWGLGAFHCMTQQQPNFSQSVTSAR